MAWPIVLYLKSRMNRSSRFLVGLLKLEELRKINTVVRCIERILEFIFLCCEKWMALSWWYWIVSWPWVGRGHDLRNSVSKLQVCCVPLPGWQYGSLGSPVLCNKPHLLASYFLQGGPNGLVSSISWWPRRTHATVEMTAKHAAVSNNPANMYDYFLYTLCSLQSETLLLAVCIYLVSQALYASYHNYWTHRGEKSECLSKSMADSVNPHQITLISWWLY